MTGRTLLTIGGSLSALAALMHLAIILGGPDWYRFFGAGEDFAQADARGERWPALMTFGIAVILAIWAAYAYSAAGHIARLPLLRTGLIVISAIYLTRALAYIPVLAIQGQPITAFAWWSSLIVLIYGLCHALGTLRAWPGLSPAS